MTLHRLSQAIALALVPLTIWTLASMAGLTPASEFAPVLYGALLAMTALAFGLIFLGLRLGTAGSVVYWRGEVRSRQLRGIALIVLNGICILFVVGLVLDRSGRFNDLSASATSLLVWVAVPAVFLGFGWVRWPKRLRPASALTLLLAGVPAAVIAAVVACHSALASGVELSLPPFGLAVPIVVGVVIAAGAEEVIFRTLLLTALLDRGASRFQAVFLSGVIFATAHAPLALGLSTFDGDGSTLAYAVHAYAPAYLGQLLLGLLLGTVWLRTGSISLVTAIHTVCNLGPALAFALSL